MHFYIYFFLLNIDLLENDILDSLAFIELITSLEEEFNQLKFIFLIQLYILALSVLKSLSIFQLMISKLNILTLLYQIFINLFIFRLFKLSIVVLC